MKNKKIGFIVLIISVVAYLITGEVKVLDSIEMFFGTSSVAQNKLTPENSPTVTVNTQEIAFDMRIAQLASYSVVRVIDGDTIVLDNSEKVRYVGIDAPEVSGKKECFGEEATKLNKQLVEGKTIWFEKDVSVRDAFGRLLGYVYTKDGSAYIMVNKVMVNEGYAIAREYKPDIKYSSELRLSMEEAQLANRGMWEKCGLNPKM